MSLFRFSVENNMEVIPSSNPDSLEDFDQDQFKESQINDPYKESFFKCSPGQRKLENQIKGRLIFVRSFLTVYK